MMEWIPFALVTVGLIGTIDAIIQTSKYKKYNRDENND
jgi:hypothetical protein